MLKKRICFIVNPISGIGRQKVIEKLIFEQLDRSIFDYEIAYTIAAKHAIEIAPNDATRNFEFVVAVGGDGS
jgi:diacylglycerol kinase (ATP)